MTDKAIELVSIFANGGALLLGILLTFRKLDDNEDDALADAIINEAEADAMVELHEAAHPIDGVPYNWREALYCPQEDRDGE